MFLGLDIGTQSLKAVLVDDTLQLRGRGSAPYQPSFPQPGWAEQDPTLWERALGPAIAEALRDADCAADDVTVLACAGQLDGCLPVDSDGRALGPALIWMDRRASDLIEDLEPTLIRERGGLVLDASHMAAKMRWCLAQNGAGPALFHQPVSYLTARLTGEAVMDHGLASTTMLYNLEARDYDPALLDHFGVTKDKLPKLAEASAIAGQLTETGAALTGLRVGLPVAVGTGDDFSAPLGAGLGGPGRLACTLGSAEVVGALHPTAVVDPDSLVETHAFLAGQYFIENPGWLSGGALTWFQGCHDLSGPEAIDDLATASTPGAEGLCFLPALSGAMAPRWRAAARGAFYGLTPSHGRAELARALLEGSAFAMRDVAERLNSLGVACHALLLSGGGAKSEIWAQIRADLTGLPAEIPIHLDSSPLGAALLAAAAVGGIEDLGVAAKRINPTARTVEPNSEHKPAYDEAYGRYRLLFATLEPLFNHWARAEP